MFRKGDGAGGGGNRGLLGTSCVMLGLLGVHAYIHSGVKLPLLC